MRSPKLALVTQKTSWRKPELFSLGSMAALKWSPYANSTGHHSQPSGPSAARAAATLILRLSEALACARSLDLESQYSARDVMTPYSGMLPGLVAGHYRFSDCHIDLRALCAWANVRLIQTKAENLDPSTGTIYCQNRAPVRYDLLSINIGSSPALDSVDGAAATGVAVKPVARLIPSP